MYLLYMDWLIIGVSALYLFDCRQNKLTLKMHHIVSDAACYLQSN